MGKKRKNPDLLQIIEDFETRKTGKKGEKKASRTPENGEKTAYSHPGKRRTEKEKTEKKTARFWGTHAPLGLGSRFSAGGTELSPLNLFSQRCNRTPSGLNG